MEATSGRWKKDFDDPLVTMSGWLALEAGLYNYYTRRSVLRQWGLFLAVGFAGLRLVPDEWHWLWAKVVPGLFAVVVIGPRVIL